jgi:hypothetical protein
MLDKTFTAAIIEEDKKGGWTYVIWPESATFFGTRKPVKVKGTIDGIPFQATFLPWGDGTHMLPIKAATLKAIKKQAGEDVEVVLQERL